MPITSQRLKRWLREGGLAVLGLVVVAALGLWLYARQVDRNPIVRLTLTAGSPEGTRQLIAQALSEAGAAAGIPFGLVETAGSEAALDRLERNLTDLALIQGGLRLAGRQNVQLVTPLHLEPLHLLVKRELSDAVRRNLSALAGCRINLGEAGSGTSCLAAAVLEFVGLRPGTGRSPDSYRASMLSYSQLMAEPDRAQLPEAVFNVSTLPSLVARFLVTERGYDLVPIPFSQAFQISALTDEEPSRLAARLVAANPADEIKREHVEPARIPAYTYDVEPPVPENDVETMGTRLLLVCRKGLDPEVVSRLLDVVFNSRFAQVISPPLTSAVLTLPPEIPRHPGAVAYLQRNQPIFAGDLLDMAEKWVSIAGVTGGVFWFFWQWYRRRERLSRDRGFEAYILKVDAIEQQVNELELAAELSLERLFAAQRELIRLKQEALRKFAMGDLEGEELMSGFLSQVSDVREFVTRLILHQRDNLEQSARAMGSEAAALWPESRGSAAPPSSEQVRVGHSGDGHDSPQIERGHR